MRALATIFAALALTACGGGSDSKDLFSLWNREGNNAPLDLSGAGFGTENYLNAYTQDGTRCICNLAIIGTQESGTIAITGCIASPYDASRDPQCKTMNGSGTYSKSPDVLTITRDGQSGTFR